MGTSITSLFRPQVIHVKVEERDQEERDARRRNSLAFYISQFVQYENEDFAPLIDTVMHDKYAKTGGKPPAVRHSKFSRIADSILEGNIQELRNQVFVYFKSINRRYKDHHHGDTIMHMICQEGYYSMLAYMFNPANRSGLDDAVDLEVNPTNDKRRVPLFMCFTPPCATKMGMKHGLDAEGNIIAVQPDSIEQPGDWVKPGGPKSRENCIKLLLEQGANVHEKDFQGFTALHFASMWGWTSTIRLLLDHGADPNCLTDGGRSPLMYAVENGHINTVAFLAAASTVSKYGVKIDLGDAEGVTALLLAVDQGPKGIEMTQLLLSQGADPNVITLRRRTALKIACQKQHVEMVNLLLDHNAQRRKSAFILLEDAAMATLQTRLLADERKAVEAELKAEKEFELQEKLTIAQKSEQGRLRKRPAEAWVEYLDKLSHKPFYYNSVTRKSTFDKPKEFKPNRNRVVKEAVYGMSFYHG